MAKTVENPTVKAVKRVSFGIPICTVCDGRGTYGNGIVRCRKPKRRLDGNPGGEVSDDGSKRVRVTGMKRTAADGRRRSGNDISKLSMETGRFLVNGMFKIKIPPGFAELVTAMDGCVCRYIRKKSKVGKIAVMCTSSSSSSDHWKLIMFSDARDRIRTALKLFNQVYNRQNMADRSVVEIRRLPPSSFDRRDGDGDPLDSVRGRYPQIPQV